MLKPFHEGILHLLGTFPTDLTSGQDIKPFGDPTQNYWSIDLTSATDRFPLSLQKDVVSMLMGEKFSDAWQDMMVGEPFVFRNLSIRYATGQPMGLYSSWTVFALTHHLFIQYAADSVGIRHFTDYRVLGDDVVIRNNRVALEYLRLLDLIGVEVSKDKTLVSPNSFEFAKRFF